MKKIFSTFFAFLFAVVLGLFASCNKLSKASNSGIAIPATPDSVVLKSRVIVIDSTKLILISSPSQLSNGIYVYNTTANPPFFIANDIIIGITGEGYLRKVTAVMSQQNQVVLSTIQARLEDVFQQANINFSNGASNLPGTASNNIYLYSLSNVPLYRDAASSGVITTGSISINPTWNFNMQFQNGTITGFSAISQNATLNATLQMNITSTTSDNINSSDTVNAATGTTIVWIGELPIVITTQLAFIANVSGSVTGAGSSTLSLTNKDTYTLGNVYTSGTWQNQYNFANSSTLSANAPGPASLNVNCNIVPQTNVLLYGIVCPTAAISLNTFEAGNTSSSSASWDFSAALTQRPALSVSGAILGYAVPDNSNSWNTDTITYKTPYLLSKISGDGQIGTSYQYLSQPLIVRVTDSKGNAQANVPVYFSVTSGGGTLSNNTVYTNSNGYAETNWLIGNPAATSQHVQVAVTTANGSQISGSPLTFIAL